MSGTGKLQVEMRGMMMDKPGRQNGGGTFVTSSPENHGEKVLLTNLSTWLTAANNGYSLSKLDYKQLREQFKQETPWGSRDQTTSPNLHQEALAKLELYGIIFLLLREDADPLSTA